MASCGEGGFAFFDPGDILIDEKRFLGAGGFGGVRLATHKSWGEVAVKQFEQITLNDDIRREAKKMWRGVTCPYLVRIMGIIEDPDKPLSIVMEFFEYGDLQKFNNKFMIGYDCWARKIKMIQEIALGMNFLHTQTPPIIHRDLKLDNVFVGDGFAVKIGDLGLSLSAKTVQEMGIVHTAGTFTHIPPEGWSNSKQKPDRFWDIFLFAITLFELLTGLSPWLEHADPLLVSTWVRAGQRPDKDRLPADAPTEIVSLMEECWNGTPSDRPEFQEIQQIVSNIYQRQYKSSIRRADRAIMDRIDTEAVEASRDTLQTKDSGKGDSDSDFWKSPTTSNVDDNIADLRDSDDIVDIAPDAADSTDRPEEDEGLRFHRLRGKNAIISNEGLTATRLNAQNSAGHAVTMSNRPLKDGEMFEFVIDKLTEVWHGSLNIGVTSIKPDKVDFPRVAIGLRHDTWILGGVASAGNIVYKDGNDIGEYKLDIGKVEALESIGMKRTPDGNVHFFLDGIDQGVAFEQVPPGVYAVIDLYGKCVQVTIKH